MRYRILLEIIIQNLKLGYLLATAMAVKCNAVHMLS
jgi:hypothetical protein